MATERTDEAMLTRTNQRHSTDVVVVDHHGPARQAPVAADERQATDEIVREMRSSALAELRRLAGPNSGARARELMAEVRRYDTWLGEGR